MLAIGQKPSCRQATYDDKPSFSNATHAYATMNELNAK